MEAKQVKDLLEAYSSIYEKKEDPEMEEGEKEESEKDEGGKHKEGKHKKGKEEKGEKVTEKEDEDKEDEKKMKEEVELGEDAAYDRNRRRAAQRAQARNEARARGQTGSVPGVGYVSPRPERATYTDSAGVVRHHTGARMPKKEDQKESYDLFDYILEHLVAEGYADTNKAALAIMANMSEEWREDIVEGMTMKDFKANRRKLQRREASIDAEKRGHVSKNIVTHGRKYSPDEAKSNRANMSDYERSARKSFAMNPDQVGDTRETADKTKNPNKLRKQKAMGEH